jgi:hypothetical protein
MPAPGAYPELIILAQRCGGGTLGIAVARGRIAALGTRRSVLGIRRRGTRVLDLGRAAVTPGLVDCHTHFFYWALSRSLVIDVSTLSSFNATLHKIHGLTQRRRAGVWIIARGFDHNAWEHGLPCATDLDRAVPDHAAMVRSHDGHTVWLNTAALRHVGITASTSDPKGGRYVRDSHGRPTGIVQESAIDDLPDPLGDLARRTDAAARRTIDRALAAAYRIAWAHGIVGVHAMDDGATLFHLQRQHAERRLGLRVVHAVPLANLNQARELGLRTRFGDDWLRLGGIKIFADGALGSQTGHLFTPYPGRGDYCGVPVVAGEELRETVRSLAQCGWAAWIHAIGDRAVHDSVRAIVAARRVEATPLPHRIEHAQCVRPGDVRRMAAAKIIASVQPCHLLADIPLADRHWPRARRHAFPLRSLLDAGVTLAAGSDVPVETIDPRRSLFAATMRTDVHGEPAGGWFPQERIRTREIILAFTRGGGLVTCGSACAGRAGGPDAMGRRSPARGPARTADHRNSRVRRGRAGAPRVRHVAG